MDHISGIRTMSVRRLVRWAFVLTLAVSLGILFAAGWWLDSRGALDFPTAAALVGLVTIVVAAVVWFNLDRLLKAHEWDHRSLPARPEFYDFDDLNQPMHAAEMGGKRLRELTFVVFDTETTGLRPSRGDEIISIAGVKVRDGVMDNPGGPIPKDSIQYHGITDDMVADEPGLGAVLPAFKAWVGESILVAHNAAFDMKFLRLKEDSLGIRFDNLVLDTLLLSVFLEHESQNHSLDAIAERMGINIDGRHTALGDSFATAEVLIRMFDMLEARGITTLRQAVDASSKIEHVRKLQEQF
ncbi:MAG: exonuclease domain-containing protein [Rhodospirillaceae bacterium]